MSQARWYLTRAYRTIVAMYKLASWYVHEGLMDGTNFRTVSCQQHTKGLGSEIAMGFCTILLARLPS